MSSSVLGRSANLLLADQEFKMLSQADKDYYLWLLRQLIAKLKREKLLLYLPNPKQEMFHKAVQRIRVILGGNRCLAGETMIYDPELGKVRRLDQIGGPFHVFSWTGERLAVAKASKPFVKGFGQIYAVALSNGKRILASPFHRLLTPEGFVPAGQIRRGSVVCTPSRCLTVSNKASGSSERSLGYSGSEERLRLRANRTLGKGILALSQGVSDGTIRGIR